MSVVAFITPAFAGVVAGFALLMVSAAADEEKWQVAYGVLGLMLLFWSFGFFSMGRVTKIYIPALTMFFGFTSLYTKGTAQLVSIIVTVILFFQIFYV